MLGRRRFIAAAAVAGASIAAPRRAHSQGGGKLTRMIVGCAPGGSSDVTARLLVEQMRGYASTIIIDNRPGAGGRIAVETAKAGAPDGSVLLLSPASMIVLYPHLYKPLGYDPVQDFVAVTTVCAFPFVLSVGPLVPRDVRTLADFIQWCKANPKLASYGTSGAGSMLHFAGIAGARREFRFHPRALQGRVAGSAGSPGWPGRVDRGRARHRAAAYPGREPAGAGDDRSDAFVVPARRPHAHGGGLFRARDHGMARPVRAGQDAAGGRSRTQSFRARCARHRRGESRLDQAVLRGRWHQPRAIRRPRESGHRPLGADREGLGIHAGELSRHFTLAKVADGRRRLRAPAAVAGSACAYAHPP